MRYYFCLCSFLIPVILASCKNDSVITGPQSGNVSGYIQLYDADGNSASSSVGVKVAVSGSDKTAQTDDSGKWVISDLSAGVYTFIFTKDGFGMTKIIAYQFVGSGTAYVSGLQMTRPSRDILNFQDFSVTLNADSTRSYNIIAAMPPPYTEIRSVLLCIGTDSAALANDPSSASLVSALPKAGSGYDGNFNISGVDIIDRTKNLLWKGTKLYATLAVAGEGRNCQLLSNYFDPSINKQVYTAISPHSQILSAVMP